jgi:hypothetical protein
MTVTFFPHPQQRFEVELLRHPKNILMLRLHAINQLRFPLVI